MITINHWLTVINHWLPLINWLTMVSNCVKTIPATRWTLPLLRIAIPIAHSMTIPVGEMALIAASAATVVPVGWCCHGISLAHPMVGRWVYHGGFTESLTPPVIPGEYPAATSSRLSDCHRHFEPKRDRELSMLATNIPGEAAWVPPSGHVRGLGVLHGALWLSNQHAGA